MISCYDQRPLNEIRDELGGTNLNDIDLVSVCMVLCDRISALEAKVGKKQVNSADKACCYECETYKSFCAICVAR